MTIKTKKRESLVVEVEEGIRPLYLKWKNKLVNSESDKGIKFDSAFITSQVIRLGMKAYSRGERIIKAD